MAGDGSFLVEDFLGAIASQLDRTQDALAVKALNRPLTYAIKDFTMELKVFVDMDQEGKVRLRSPGANEPGASTMHIGFTTVTRPMIEENTQDIALTRAPTLQEAGLPEADRQRLERLGVRTTAELQNLGGNAGAAGASRLAGVPVERLRAALMFGRPTVRHVRPVPAKKAPAATPSGGAPRPPATPGSGAPRPPATPGSGAPRPPATPGSGAPRPPAMPGGGAPTPRPPAPSPRVPAPPPRAPVLVPPATRRVELVGRNLVGLAGPPAVRLDGRPLNVAEAEDERLVVELPDDAPSYGTLEVDHGDGEVEAYELALEHDDPWAPA